MARVVYRPVLSAEDADKALVRSVATRPPLPPQLKQTGGGGPGFREHACKLGLEGVISKLADRPYAPGNRGIWVKSKCLNREEFVVVGRTDPEGGRSHLGALLLGYYTEDGRLLYAVERAFGYLYSQYEGRAEPH